MAARSPANVPLTVYPEPAPVPMVEQAMVRQGAIYDDLALACGALVVVATREPRSLRMCPVLGARRKLSRVSEGPLTAGVFGCLPRLLRLPVPSTAFGEMLVTGSVVVLRNLGV